MNKSIGQSGELLVASILKEQGYKIIKTNYKTRMGELDIIALDDDTICFVEVKTRLNDELGDGLEAITDAKKRTISKLAQYYLMEHHLEEHNARFDVVAVLGNPDCDPKVEIIKNAFELV